VNALLEWDEIEVGHSLPSLRVPLRRVDLVMYAGASGDFNPIHWNDRTARAFGLPDVIAHEMLTMALAGRIVTDWAGDPGAVESFSVRFAHPVAVPDDDSGAVLDVEAVVAAKLDGERVRVDITVSLPDDGDSPAAVLKNASAVVRL
jgi:acyl dehydratase